MPDATSNAPARPRIDVARTRAVAGLARLALSDAEIVRYAAQLSAIFDFMQTIQRLDTERVEPFSHAPPTVAATRSDNPQPGLSHDQALANAPDVARDCFHVPAFLTREGAF